MVDYCTTVVFRSIHVVLLPDLAVLAQLLRLVANRRGKLLGLTAVYALHVVLSYF